MWRIEAPTVDVTQAARACASGLRDQGLAARVTASMPAFASNSTAFQQAVSTHQQHTIQATSYQVPHLSDRELRDLYEKQMAKAGRPGRSVYSEILAGALHGLCTYCQYGQASTLDHFVPKTVAAALAIDPWNLIPCCHQCNHRLSNKYSSQAEEQLLHPYSVPDLGRWLQARVLHTVPVAVQFMAEPTIEADQLCERVVHQFRALGLAESYAVVSTPEVTAITRTIAKYLPDATAREVSEYLAELADGELGANQNSRRGVALEALAMDSWYCSREFIE